MLVRRFLISLTVLTALTAALAVAALAPPASAAALSAGCATINTGLYNGFYSQATPLLDFAAGEHITITAAAPYANGTPTQVSLSVDGGTSTVDTAAFPGTVEYTFPSADTYSLGWFTDSPDQVTWTVSCSAFDPKQAIADLQGTV